MTCSNSSPVPSKATIEWSSGMTIRIWEPGRSLRVSVNSLLSPRRPCHGPAAEHMGVHMPDRLSRSGTGVEHDPVSAVGDALGDGDLVRLGDELVEQAVTGAGQGGDVRVMVARDHQDVRGRLRVDVPEGDDALTVKHHRSRDLPGRDTAEQALWHTTIIMAGGRWSDGSGTSRSAWPRASRAGYRDALAGSAAEPIQRNLDLPRSNV